MESAEHEARRIEAIKANIQTMADLLSTATARAADAATRSANERDQNGAIGTLVGIEQDLESVLALYRAALTLHQRPRSEVEVMAYNPRDKFTQPWSGVEIIKRGNELNIVRPVKKKKAKKPRLKRNKVPS